MYVFNVLMMGLSNMNDLFEYALGELLQSLEGMVNILVFGSRSGWLYWSAIFGHWMSTQSIKLYPDKVKVIKEWPRQTNVNELHSFLGSVNYLSRFIPELSCLRTPLQPLFRNNTDFLWLQSHTNAFDKIKCAISEDCLLQFYNASHPLLIQCDVSKKGLGCVLLQPVDKNITNYDISNFSDKEMESFCNI